MNFQAIATRCASAALTLLFASASLYQFTDEIQLARMALGCAVACMMGSLIANVERLKGRNQ